MQKMKFIWNLKVLILILVIFSSTGILIANYIYLNNIEVDENIKSVNNTIFTVSNEHEVFFGNSEDGNRNQKYLKIWFSPAMNEETYGCAFFSLLGDDSNEEVVGIAIGGINSEGLCFDANEIPPPSFVHYSPSLGLVASYNSFWEMILSECSSVLEVREWYRTHNMGGWWGYQIHWADKSGDALIISPTTFHTIAYTRKTGDYLVSTNFNPVNHSQGFYPCRRYEFVVNYLDDITYEREINQLDLTSILNAVTVPEKGDYIGTVYSNIFELTTQTIYLYIQRDFNKEIMFDLNIELNKGIHAYSFPILANTNSFDRYWTLLFTVIFTICMVGMSFFIDFIYKKMQLENRTK